MVAQCKDLAVPDLSRLVYPVDFFTQEALSDLMVSAYRGTTDWKTVTTLALR